MLIYQILGKFPLEVVVKLEDAKKDEQWTMVLLRQLLNQHITIQENAQRRVANAKGRVYTYNSRQIRQSEEFNKGDRQMYNETPNETYTTNVHRGSGKVKHCVFCKGDRCNDECDNFKLLPERKQRLI